MAKIDHRVLMKDALQKIKQLQTDLDTVTQKQTEPIAIIGVGCRFPGDSQTPEQYWRMLTEGVDAVVPMPDHRRAYPEYAEYLPPCYGGFLDRIDTFDSTFFRISPREATMIDPQQRLLLEVTWEALESAAIVPDTLFNSLTGVFVGISNYEYATYALNHEAYSAEDELHWMTGLSLSAAAGRVAYSFGFTGPAISIDTACSSSLVSIHEACQSLRNQECDLAVAGGANALVNDFGIANEEGGGENRMYALDGRCKTFDAAANGFGRGEGCGMVVLKRLSDAQSDGDTIMAVIRGSMVNQDGRSSGLSAPSGPSQQAVIRHALRNAGVEPKQVGYVEAHGTGTTLGDPIEIGALNAVFRKRSDPLWVGSVKTNFGHLESAAGIASVIKTVLMLQHGQIPPNLNFHTPNPYIDWDGSPVQIPLNVTEWSTNDTASKRIAGISSFGISGTNAHIIVEEADLTNQPANHPTDESEDASATGAIPSTGSPWHLLTLSAKTEESLAGLVEKYSQFLETTSSDLANICYTGHIGRSHFDYRLSIPACSKEELQALLNTYSQDPANGATASAIHRGFVPSHHHAPSIAFLFTGQGSQYVGMGQALYQNEPTFRAILEQCDKLLQEYSGESLLRLLYPATSHQPPATSHQLDQTQYTQPALFALEVALAALWQSWGIQPTVLIGHSVGEIAAACVAGVFSLEDGLKLVAARGKLMGALPQDGEMVSFMTDEIRVKEAIAPYADEVSIAAVNGPQSVVISGKREAVLEITRQLESEGIKARRLAVSHAFHSPLMEPMLDEFRQVAQSITYSEPKQQLVSNLTGQLAGNEITTSEYWVRHVRDAVRFADGLQTLHEQEVSIFLEIGPKPVLLGMVGDKVSPIKALGDETEESSPHPLTSSSPRPISLPSLRENQDDNQQIFNSLGELYVQGVIIDWHGLEGTVQRVKVTIPTYAFSPQRCWIETKRLEIDEPPSKDGFASWMSANLAADTMDDLADLIASRSEFGEDERETVTKVLTTLDAESRAQRTKAEVESMLYQVAWEQQKLSRATVMPPTTPGCWLILADERGVGQKLATQLTEFGETVHLFSASAEETRWQDSLISLGQVGADSLPLRGILYLWGLNSQGAAEGSANLSERVYGLMQSQEQNLGSVLQIVQELTMLGHQEPNLWIITQGAQQLSPTEQVAVDQTPLWGMGRVIALEHGELWGGMIDLEPSVALYSAPFEDRRLVPAVEAMKNDGFQSDCDIDGELDGEADSENSWLENLSQAILAEILKPEADGEEQVAYRNGQRYVARFVPTQPATLSTPLAIRDDGRYLVTGGLGSLGLQTSYWLAQEGARHLILTGRSGVRTKEQEGILTVLRNMGVEITVAQMDVADEIGMTKLFEEIEAAEYPLRGIIHAAGVGGFTPIHALQWDDFVTVLRPKIIGGWLLHHFTQALELDFLVGYSSGAGIWGGKHQSHYAAANHFLDGLMASRRSQGLPGLSIAWGPWAGNRALPSMATPEAQALFLAMGVHTLSSDLGLEIQAHLMLQTEASQVTAADIDWSLLKPLYEMTKPRRFLAKIVVAKPEEKQSAANQGGQTTAEASSFRQELQSLSASQRLEALRRYAQQILGQVLGMADASNGAVSGGPSIHTGFADLGMDSLMALELRSRLESGLGCSLPSTVAFEYPTVDQLAKYLLDEVLALAKPQSAGQTESPRAVLDGSRGGSLADEPIAVISMACRFPGAETPEAFWDLLQNGMDMVQEMPLSRWDVDEFYDSHRPMPGKMYTREAAFIENVKEFDPLFFGISPREAVGIDPQHRLLLEVSWEALERAGLAQSALVDSLTGVFVGISPGDYDEVGAAQGVTDLDIHALTSGGNSVAAGRLAYTLGLQGPTMAVDTACSSSLVSFHLACQSLRLGECDLALAGGVNLFLTPFGHIALSQMQALATDGRCKSFDAAADGYGRGEGVGMILLKRLSDAQANGDTILAVVKGSAVNHDGLSSGLTVPNKRAQEKLLRHALANAKVTPDEVAYIEAHGTGTSLGDPIEIRALGSVFGADRAHPLLVGSVKSNIGHLEAAAGVAGLMKMVLSLYYGQIPPHLHFNTPNPYIEWDEYAIDIPTVLQPWPQENGSNSIEGNSSEAALEDAHQPIAGISSFGLSGTNAHIVMTAAPKNGQMTLDQDYVAQDNGLGSEDAQIGVKPSYLLPLSARDSAALSDLAKRYIEHLGDHPEIGLGDLSFSAASGRNHFNHRLGIVAATVDELKVKLKAVEQDEEVDGLLLGTVATSQSPIAFLFTGQGSQYVGMGYTLYETEPIFQQIIDRCEVVAQEVLGRSLIELLYPPSTPDHNDILDSHPCGQAVNFAVECALVELWKAWGIQPDFVLGHSLGDFAAAYAAGVFSLEDGLRLVSERGRLMEQAVGSMVSVMGAELDVAPFVEPYEDVVIGVINGPTSVVISGGHEHVMAVADGLEAAGFKTRKVSVPMAAHSPLLDPVLDEFETLIRQQIPLNPPIRSVVSSMTGGLITDELTDPAYWRQHLRNPVRFVDSVETLAAEACTVFIEIGPKPTLLGMVGQIFEEPEKLTLLPSLHHEQDCYQQILTCLGSLYIQGFEVDWLGLHQMDNGGAKPCKVMLPTYPFQRQTCWVETQKKKQTAALRPLIEKVTPMPLHKEIVFEREFSVETLPFLADHVVFERVVSPGSCQVAMALSAAELLLDKAHVLCLEDIILPQALVLLDEETRTVQLIVDMSGDSDVSILNGASHLMHGAKHDFKLVSFDLHADVLEPQIHATGYIVESDGNSIVGTGLEKPELGEPISTNGKPAGTNLDVLRRRCDQPVAVAEFYAVIAMVQIEFGPSFRWLAEAWYANGASTADASSETTVEAASETTPEVIPEVLGKLVLPDALRLSDHASAHATDGHLLHPGLLDACFQVAGLASKEGEGDGTLLPFAIETLHLYQPMQGETWWCHAIQRKSHMWDIHLMDEQGESVVVMQGFEVRSAAADAVRGSDLWREWLYQIEWQPRAYFGLAPDYLPAPESMTSALIAQTQALWAEQEGESYQRFLSSLDELSIDYVLAAFAKANFVFQAGARWTTEQIAQLVGVIPSQRRLLERLLVLLVEANILQREADLWSFSEEPDLINPAARVAELRASFSQNEGSPSELHLLERCGERLSEVLRGLQDPLELLFPGEDDTVTAQQHTVSPAAQVMNHLIGQLIQTVLMHLPPERGLRIIEIGAGTGGTTTELLPLLSKRKVEYYFTDIGPSFLLKAQEQFSDYDFLRYQLLDIEQSPSTQGFIPNQADVVIAANVLHATKDMSETLTNVRALLQPGGQLVLLEGTTPSPWVDLTFGLTDGWWRFADERATAQWNHPLLSTDRWMDYLQTHGFQNVAVIEQGAQAVILAQADDLQAKAAQVDNNTQVTNIQCNVENAQPMLIFADGHGIAEGLTAQFQQQNVTPILVYAAPDYQQLEAHIYQINPECAEDYTRLLDDCYQAGGSQSDEDIAHQAGLGIAHLWSLDAAPLMSGMDLLHASRQNCGTVLHLTQALLEQDVEVAGLWLVTREAQAISEKDGVNGVVQAGLWGMGRTIGLEHPELNCVLIDLDGEETPSIQSAYLYSEMRSAYDIVQAKRWEDQVAFRRDARYVARLARYEPDAELSVPSGPYRLEITERGLMDSLKLQPAVRRNLGPGEVEIQVQASGLNFLDVLDALGILPFERAVMGGECAGEIVALGEGVTHFQVGERVVALAGGGFSRYTIAPSNLVVPISPALTFAQAASIPSNFLTAHYSLRTVANIQPGDKVLIHAATGGTGMAAVQIAQHVGAEIYATASPAKWETLREMGITNIYSSRALDFAEQILTDTQGQGVNIVLNSLTGEGFIEKSLSVLSPEGRFLEIAKRDVMQADEVDTVRGDIDYHYIDLLSVTQENPETIGKLLAELISQFETGILQLLPQTCFPIQHAVDAFRYMQQAKHIGKILLTAPTEADSTIQSEGTYLITGGLGGLGLAVAQWLAEQGARHLVLMGRSGPKPEAEEQLEMLADMDVTVTVAQADVTALDQVTQVLQQIDSRYPLRGVIHSVGVLEDNLLIQQDWEKFARVLAPKMQGAWHLHEQTKELPLDFFVLFSSMTGLLGNRGQANHAAANTFLDSFVYYRRKQGLPALSINWGGWSEIGSAADLLRENRQLMAAIGQGTISPQQGIEAFAYLLNQNQTEDDLTQVGVMPMQWTKFMANANVATAFYANFEVDAGDGEGSILPESLQTVNLVQQLAEANGEERAKMLLEYLRTAAAKVLGLRNPAQIDENQGLLDMGLDSLMAIELRNRLSRTLEQKLPSTLIFDYPTIVELHQFLLEKFAATYSVNETANGAMNDLGNESVTNVGINADDGQIDGLSPSKETPHQPAQEPVSTDIAELSAEELMSQIAEDFKILHE
ncbi:MAG: SDR family NAD(P)-dependent oxidoreductase [Chloroflexota bacterium]